MSLLVSVQLALYALLWGLGSVALKEERPAILQWLGYALASAASAALLAWRPDGPVWLTHSGSSAATLLSLVLAGRGAVLFLGLRPNDRLFMAVGCVAAVGLAWIGPNDTASRMILSTPLNIVVLLSVFLQARQTFIQEFGPRMAVLAAFPTLALICINAYFFAQGLMHGSVNIAGTGVVPAATWVVTLVSAAAFNYLFLFLVGFRMQQNLRRQASRDALTGLPNRRAMEQRLQLEWDRSLRYGKPFVVICADVDHFKRINDQYGHAVGDQALIAVARALQATARDTDHVSRFGGEEFVILMPEAHTERDGVPLAERLRAAIADLTLTGPAGEAITLTASFGVSGWLACDQDREHVLRRADNALYEAKDQGRDCVVLKAE
ncbi:MAG: GGDEF domain-containing protein [Rhodoferax sp.]|nr:GGDEF domain-containing protein [Rhodoferax sp.]